MTTYIVAFDRRVFGKMCASMNEPLPEKSDKVIFEDLNDVLEMGAAKQFYVASALFP